MTKREAGTLKPGKKIYVKETNEKVEVVRCEGRKEGDDTYYYILRSIDNPDNVFKMGHKWLSLQPIKEYKKRNRRKY